MIARVLACVSVVCVVGGCAGTRNKPHELTRELTAWEQLGNRIAELEVTSLVRLKFGCSGCTRFVANELIVQPNGDFRVYDVSHRTEKSQGKASAEALEALKELLASDEWRLLEEGPNVGTQSPPWLEIRSTGKRVLRLTPTEDGKEPALDRMLAALDAVMSAGR